jgi:hypothetical protein
MQTTQRKRAYTSRVNKFNKLFKGRPEPTIDEFKASVAGILAMDHFYHLEGLVKLLNDHQELVVAIAETTPHSCKREAMKYAKLIGIVLKDIEKEFLWQSHHGIRLYKPM